MAKEALLGWMFEGRWPEHPEELWEDYFGLLNERPWFLSGGSEENRGHALFTRLGLRKHPSYEEEQIRKADRFLNGIVR